MIVDLLIIFLSVAAVLYGADRLTEGAVSVARRLGVSELVVGITVVAFGTSMPELCVSLTSALQGQADMAVGNLIGSTVFNSLLIVGAAAAICPILLSKKTVRVDMPVTVAAAGLFIIAAMGGVVNRVEGLVLSLLFFTYMTYLVKQARRGNATAEDVGPEKVGMPKSFLLILLGLVLLVVGSDYFVAAATRVATALGMSEAVIGLTIVAGGTSFPELATSCVAARKGQSAIAIGNVIGSNVFNILLITGLTATVSPLSIAGISMLDYVVLAGSALLLWVFSATQCRISRLEGVVLVLAFATYMSFLILHSLG